MGARSSAPAAAPAWAAATVGWLGRAPQAPPPGRPACWWQRRPLAPAPPGPPHVCCSRFSTSRRPSVSSLGTLAFWFLLRLRRPTWRASGRAEVYAPCVRQTSGSRASRAQQGLCAAYPAAGQRACCCAAAHLDLRRRLLGSPPGAPHGALAAAAPPPAAAFSARRLHARPPLALPTVPTWAAAPAGCCSAVRRGRLARSHA